MQQVIFRDKKIFYHAKGSGKPVVLLHGFAENSSLWNYQVELLIKKFRVIVPDLPGSGASEMPAGEMAMGDYAEAIKTIIEAELVEGTDTNNSVTMIGHSMGGYITLAFAEKYPGLLNSFGLFHSTAYADDDAKKTARLKGIEFIKTNGAEAFIKTATPNLFSEITKRSNEGLIENLVELSKNIPPQSLIRYYAAMIQRPDRTSVLKSFQRPVLFIIGKHDAAVPLQSSLQQAHLPGLSHIHILQNSGHMGMWEENALSTNFLLNFLANI